MGYDEKKMEIFKEEQVEHVNSMVHMREAGSRTQTQLASTCSPPSFECHPNCYDNGRAYECKLTCYSHPGVEGMVGGGLLMELGCHRLTRGRVEIAGVPGGREGPRGSIVART